MSANASELSCLSLHPTNEGREYNLPEHKWMCVEV